MPEETFINSDIQSEIVHLEDYHICSKTRHRHYKKIQSALENDKHFSAEELSRLLAVCAHDTPVMEYAATVINILPLIVSKYKIGCYDPPLDLLPSILEVIKLLKTLALLGKTQSLMSLCLDALLSYPEETLVKVVEFHCEDVIEIFRLCCHTKESIQNTQQACNLLHKLLKILPPEKKRVFIENGVSVWFSKIIPMVMKQQMSSVFDINTYTNIEILELLTDDLVHVDYTNNAPWNNILESICMAKQYPAIMKNLLTAGSDAWYRLWTVFIRLLKNQITQSLSSVGTPINSMLPVVEAAFKLDVAKRCKAFECWNVLIDSFATETNESNINKRIKLLIIPLKSNNAKTEETAIAKFKCWWHLIRKFQNKMDKFLDIVLVSFLHFCFGRHNSADKSAIIPGQISPALKKYCNEALVDMVGHVNCVGCTDLPKLKVKVINTKHLVDNWNHWIFSLTSVIMKTAKNDSGLTNHQMKCLWTSFLMTIGELPENNIRKDLFSEILSIIAHLVQECKLNNKFLGIVFNILILSLFEEDTKIKPLLKSVNNLNDPINRIVKIVLDPALNGFYKSIPAQELVTKFKQITNIMLDEAVCEPKSTIAWVLDEMPANDHALLLWAALTETVYESEYDSSLLNTGSLILWPFKSSDFTQVKIPALVWYTAFDLLYPKLNKTETDRSISEVLHSDFDANSLTMDSVYFKLCIVMSVLKHKFTEDSCISCEKDINLLLTLTKKINSYEYFEALMPLLVDRIVAIMCVVSSTVNDTITALILVCVKNVLHVLTQACKQQMESATAIAHITLLIGNLLKPLESVFAVESYSTLIPAMTYHLLRCSPLLSEHTSTKSVYLAVMRAIFSKTRSNDANYNKIKTVINKLEDVKIHMGVIDIDHVSDSNEFTTPQTKEVPKRINKKEASIVNTVIEDGEEYVVVKSNWKFNPRKLTENQKEKLQRKREDIPALYQDLSQSQDEFKLVSWKTDSQDTTSSSKSESKSSKTDSNKTATEILKNLSSTNVVPKILETMFSEKNSESDKVISIANDLQLKDDIRKVDVPSPVTKNPKSPRVALKDRVFRNMKNLMEGASLQKENKDTTEDSSKNNRTPPPSNKNSSNLINSASILLSADRPSRVKRKPKKFEDLQLLPIKKRRNSLPDVQSKSSQYIDGSHDVVMGESTTEKNDVNETKIFRIAADLDFCGNDENISREHDNKKDEMCDYAINMNGENDSRSHSTSITIDDSAEDLPNASSNYTESNENQIESVKSSADVGQISIPTSPTNNEEEIPPCCEETVISDSSVDAESVSTPRTSKAVKVVTSLKKSRLFSPLSTPAKSSDVKIISDSNECNVKEGSTPKEDQANKVKTISIVTNDDNETSHKISKDMDDVVTPKTLKLVNKVSTPTTSGEFKEISNLNTTEIANDVTTTPSKHISITDLSKSDVCKHVEDISIPKESNDISKEAKMVSTPRQSNSDISKEAAVVSTPKQSKSDVLKEVKLVSTTKQSKPDVSKEIKDVSTPKQSNGYVSKEINVVSSPKQVNTNVAKEAKVVSTPKQLITAAVSKEVKLVSTPKQSNENKDCRTPKPSHKLDEQKSTSKKNTAKKSRIEKELAIDMVEGHPFLKAQSTKRLTRNTLESANTGRRKSLADKLSKAKREGITPQKNDKKLKEKSKERENSSPSSVIVEESQEQNSEPKEQSSFSDELPDSEDFIESSQDSTMTIMSVKSTRRTPRKLPVVCIEKITKTLNRVTDLNNSQSILDRFKVETSVSKHDIKDDTVLPVNKTALEISQCNLTENMDTEPTTETKLSEDVILIGSDVPAMTISSEDTIVGSETQAIAEADTQPTNPKELLDSDSICETPEVPVAKIDNYIPETCTEEDDTLSVDREQFEVDKVVDNNTVDNTTVTLSESACDDTEPGSGASSPFEDEAQRQQDFMNNTVEISPIKTMSPDREKMSPPPDTSDEFVVIKLSSPVHSNGEPFEKVDSPEVFTDEKISLENREQSPPREEVTVTSTSPTSSLSLKKNRPQVRSGGRGAQMLGLCMPDRVQSIINPERNEPEEVKKPSNSTNTPARRNLRILYSSVGENIESSSSSTSENDDSDNFLKFKRVLPTSDCSPSGPILKRKFAEITDEAMLSPVSKRKRVSFHDPPVSTTISVQKYIEPGVLRSPQNSAQKRLERQLRQHAPVKSPKRLDNAFKLDSVLTKTVESFCDNDVVVIPDDTQGLSLDETPVAEVVRTSELNNTDSICAELLDCKDPIENIASDLSSPAMKSLLIKELLGTIETVGDLAKLTELEVNRLCIKAPKVTVVKKVLADYAVKIAEYLNVEEAAFTESLNEPSTKTHNIEMQTDIIEAVDIEMQTEEIPSRIFATQTESASTAHSSVQTSESGSKSSKDIIKSCLLEKPDFVEALSETLEESFIKNLSEKLLLSTVMDLMMKKITPMDTRGVLDRILEQENNSSDDKSKGLSFIRDYLCDTFATKDLLLLCSEILKIVYDKPA